MPIRLLIVAPEYPPHQGGGLARFYRTLTPALAGAGCDVTVVVASPFGNDFPAYDHDGVGVHFVPGSAVEAHAADMPHLSAAPTFRRWLAAARAAHDFSRTLGPFDLVEATDFGLMFVPFVLAEARTPVVVQCHGSVGQIAEHEPHRAELDLDLALARLTEAVVLPLADDLQTYSSQNAVEWSERLRRNVRLLPPPLASESLSAGERRDGLVVGRVQAWKGPEVLCQALRLLPKGDAPPFRWVGRDTETAPDGGSLDAWLRRTYPDVWGARVEVLGQLDYAAAAALRRQARVVVTPSTWDVFNFTAAEAMAAGSLVICADAAGASDLIESGQNGFVFRSGDPAALAAALRDAFRLGPSEARAMGKRARATVKARLDPGTVARSRLDVYRKLAGASTARSDSSDWLRGFFTGQERGKVSTAFLDQFAIADLSRYLRARVRDRVAADLRRVVSR